MGMIAIDSCIFIYAMERHPDFGEKALRASLPAIKTPDAIHAATALLQDAELFLTNDPVFLGVPGLKTVMVPDW